MKKGKRKKGKVKEENGGKRQKYNFCYPILYVEYNLFVKLKKISAFGDKLFGNFCFSEKDMVLHNCLRYKKRFPPFNKLMILINHLLTSKSNT